MGNARSTLTSVAFAAASIVMGAMAGCENKPQPGQGARRSDFAPSGGGLVSRRIQLSDAIDNHTKLDLGLVKSQVCGLELVITPDGGNADTLAGTLVEVMIIDRARASRERSGDFPGFEWAHTGEIGSAWIESARNGATIRVVADRSTGSNPTLCLRPGVDYELVVVVQRVGGGRLSYEVRLGRTVEPIRGGGS